MERCPYGSCPFEAPTLEEIDDHVAYMGMIDDIEHDPDNRVRA